MLIIIFFKFNKNPLFREIIYFSSIYKPIYLFKIQSAI